MRVLLTGATGFLGKHCLDALKDHEVIAPVRDTAKESALPGSFVVPELSDQVDWLRHLEGVDVVLHLAGRAHILKETIADPMSEFRKVNRDATLHLARQSEKAGVKRFVFVSSIGVNGNGQPAGQEGKGYCGDDAPAPHDLYAISKLEAEQGLAEMKFDWTVIRPPLIYGPGAPGNLRSLLKIMSKGVPLPFASVKNKRSFIGARNLADLLRVTLDHPNASRRVFTVAEQRFVTTGELMGLMGEGMGKPAKLFPFPRTLAKIGSSVLGKQKLFTSLFESLLVDGSEAEAALDWKPRWDTEEGIREMARAFS